MVLEKVRFFLDPNLPWDPNQQTSDTFEVLTVDGEVKIKNKYDVDFYAKYHRIDGDLSLEGSTAGNLDLPLLTEITGHLRAESNERLTRLTLKSLRIVGGSVSIVGNPVLESLVDLKKLRKVGGDFRVCDNGSLPATHPLKIRDMIMDAGGIAGNVEITDNKGF
jgi:hypothetical protein